VESTRIPCGKSTLNLNHLTVAELRLAWNAQRRLLLERIERGLDPDARSVWNLMCIAALLRVTA
jgi:hypothetical protein